MYCIVCDKKIHWGSYFFYVDTEGGGGVRKMPILLNKMSTKGGRGGQKSLKSCLRSKSMPPMYSLKLIPESKKTKLISSMLIW